MGVGSFLLPASMFSRSLVTVGTRRRLGGALTRGSWKGSGVPLTAPSAPQSAVMARVSTLTFSAGGLVESARPGPPLLADLRPCLLAGPLDGGLVALLDTNAATTLLFSVYLHSRKTATLR